MDTRCADCRNGIDHCHGTLVTHNLDFTECDEQGCDDLNASRHELRVDCQQVDPDCHCGASERTDVLRRAS